MRKVAPVVKRVRFIGYAVPTTPADVVAVGDPDDTGSLAGTYRALGDRDADIDARVAVIKAAVDRAREVLPADEPDVLNVFVAPEFFWHGVHGPYVHGPADPDPADVILDRLTAALPPDEYPGFLMVLGTVITTKVADIDSVFASQSTRVRNDVVRALGEAWNSVTGPMQTVVADALINFIKNCHAYPDVEVRNRSLILSAHPIDGILEPIGAHAVTTEKNFDSNEDFLLWDVTGKDVVTEQMTAYPVLDLTGGDFKADARDPLSVFRIGGEHPRSVGVEICLDHSDRRLRKGIDRNPWPERADGLDLQLIPSSGMQLHQASIGARAGGWVFNCDGQYRLGSESDAGTAQHAVIAGVPCAFVDYRDPAGASFGAHSQLTRVERAAVRGDDAAPGAHDAVLEAPTDVDVGVFPVAQADDFDAVFAGGPGALHIYGLRSPIVLSG
ncbi:hypothetical protein GCM10022200_17120 [Microbacterium awajiense]|uniref:CN hydrolase domain-containing protein n=1 Tax=Microbacterium awajiense TaxID=415214 RepID=A0ABP7AJY7_9MICO